MLPCNMTLINSTLFNSSTEREKKIENKCSWREYRNAEICRSCIYDVQCGKIWLEKLTSYFESFAIRKKSSSSSISAVIRCSEILNIRLWFVLSKNAICKWKLTCIPYLSACNVALDCNAFENIHEFSCIICG